MSDPTSTYLNQPLRSEAEATSEARSDPLDWQPTVFDLQDAADARGERGPFDNPSTAYRECKKRADEIEALRERVSLLENDQALGESIILRQGASAEAANAINKEMVGVLEHLAARIQEWRDEKERGSKNVYGKIVHETDREAIAGMDDLLLEARAVLKKYRGEAP